MGVSNRQSQDAAGRGSARRRRLDFWLGVPLVAASGALSRAFRRPSVPRSPRRIGVLCSAAIGDALLLSGVIRTLQAQLPDGELRVFCGASNAAAFRLFMDAWQVVEIEILRLDQSIRQISRHGPFDLWIDAGQWPRINALVSVAVRSRYKIGFKTPGQCRHWPYDHQAQHRSDRHEVENFASLLEPLGFGEVLAPKLEGFGTRNIHPERDREIVFHLFPGGTRPMQKFWPRDRWLALAKKCQSAGYSIGLTGTPENQRQLDELVAELGPSATSYADGYSLRDTAGVIASARAVVSVNTGIMHLAALLGKDLVGIHGPTSAVRWGPINENSVAIQSRLECSPCLNLGFDYGCPLDQCMQAIEVDEVFQALDRLLNAPRARA